MLNVSPWMLDKKTNPLTGTRCYLPFDFFFAAVAFLAVFFAAVFLAGVFAAVFVAVLAVFAAFAGASGVSAAGTAFLKKPRPFFSGAAAASVTHSSSVSSFGSLPF